MLLPLAEFTPISADFQINIWNVMLFLCSAATLWAAIRRRPTLDAHLSKFEASIAQLTKSVTKLTEAQELAAGHSVRIAQLERRCTELQTVIDRETSAQRISTDDSMHKIYLRIEGVEKSMATNFQSVERSLGRIEGQLSK